MWTDVPTKVHYVDGLVQSVDGRPAVERPDGSQEWWHADRLHRDKDEPAVVTERYKEWWKHGKLWRVDGRPVRECADGRKVWARDGWLT